jgi:copper chaperone CopZ
VRNRILRAAVLAAVSIAAAHAAAAPRTLSFRVNAACTCAECSFEANRVLPRFDGVRKVSLSVKDRRLDVVFEEGKRPLSELALQVSKLDMGQGSVLLWPADEDADRAAGALARVPGVRSARADAKAHAVALTFSRSPAVALAQLDAAAKGVAHASS